MSERIAKLKDAIKRLHACESYHLGSIHVKETSHPCGWSTPTEMSFDGKVEVFLVEEHKTAEVCFAWDSPDDCGGEPVAVLAGQYHKFVNDPHSAVRA
jgi:hypothetical protein